jgi:5-bromo-4-chloroindolyl phosphate hydrolysis protein
MKFLKRFLPSALVGAATFVLFSILFEAGILISTIFAIAGFLGTTLVFTPKKVDPEMKRLEEIYGITPRKIRSIVGKGKRKIKKMKKIAQTIDNPKIQERIHNISGITEKIFLNFTKDPKDVKAARQFLNYYLDATIKIIKQYSVLSKMNTDKKNREVLKKAEDLLGTIEKTYEEQLQKLYEDDFLDLDTEIQVLERSIKLDGI